MKIKLTCTCFIALFFCCSLAFAQPAKLASSKQANTSKPETNKEMHEALQTYIKAMNIIFIDNKEHSIEPVVQCLDKDYNSTRYVMDVGGYPRRTKEDLDAYRMQLAGMIGINGLAIKQTLEDISFVKTYETFGIISFSMLREVMLDKENLMKIHVFETVYLRKQQGKWLICEENVVNVTKEQHLGICPCQFVQMKEGALKYKANMLVPDGTGFLTTAVAFEFTGQDGSVKLIRANNNAYRWDPNGMLTCVQKENAEVSELLPGNANTNFKAMESILTNHIYGKQCIGLRAMPEK
jgi:hypothetical protein